MQINKKKTIMRMSHIDFLMLYYITANARDKDADT